MKITRKTETVQHTRIQITGRDILRLVSGKVKVTKETRVFFSVPGGGDYSGMDIEIDIDNPITVSSKSYDNRRKRNDTKIPKL